MSKNEKNKKPITREFDQKPIKKGGTKLDRIQFDHVDKKSPDESKKLQKKK